LIAENPVWFVERTKVLIKIRGLKSSLPTHPKHPKSRKPLKSVQNLNRVSIFPCELRYHSPVLLYLEIGLKTPSSVAGFNFLNPFLKIRELLVFVVY
jgi:hypothetical protein